MTDKPPDPTAEAEAIYQSHLDTVSDLLFSGDTQGCLAHFCLPVLIRFAEDEVVFETEQDLRRDLDELFQTLRGHQVTHYVRLVKQAKFFAPYLIEGWHETHILRDAVEVLPRYGSRLILRLENDVWKIAEAEHALQHRGHVAGRRVPAADGFSAGWGKPLIDIRATDADPRRIYQQYLETSGAAVDAADFDRWSACFAYPYQVHYDRTDHVADTPDMARPFFDLMLQKMKECGADRLVRKLDSAEFLAGDRIVGYHETSMIRDGTVCFGPVRSRMVLQLSAGEWKCTCVTNSLSNADFPGREFELSGGLPTMREIQERMRK